MDLSSIKRAAVRGLTPGRPFQNPPMILRLVIGMVIASVVGYATHSPQTQVILTVGALLAGVSLTLPHNRSRLVAAGVGSLAQAFGLYLGVTLSGQWWVVLVLAFLGFFASGMLRAVAVGISIRVVLMSILFLAFAEMGRGLNALPLTVALGFLAGAAIMLAVQLFPPYEPRYAAQRTAVSVFYRSLASGTPTAATLLAADRSLALLRADGNDQLTRFVQLVERGEEAAQLLLALQNRPESAEQWQKAASARLSSIAARIARPNGPEESSPAPWPTGPASGVQQALRRVVGIAEQVASGEIAPAASDQRRTPSSAELVRDELRPGSPIFRHALRLAIACVVGQLVGMGVAAWLGKDAIFAAHGFWVVVAIALIVFPDYGDTFARGIGRTIGTIAGALLGIALSFLPADPLLHTVVLLLLYIGLQVFRTCGQPWSMLFLVAWISSLMAGPLAATTRGIDTVIGCLIGFAAYLLFPTWQRRRLDDLLSEWARFEADRLVALNQLWSGESEERRLAVAHASVLSRVVRLELLGAIRSARSEPPHPQGRWDDAALTPAADAVTTVGRQIAALSALAPYWSEAERVGVRSATEGLAGELLVLACAEQPGAEGAVHVGDGVLAGDAVTGDGRTPDSDALTDGDVAPDTRVAVEQTSGAVAQLEALRRSAVAG
ncbi:MAG: FUSC family protein [Micropruina sp.]|uniref:FUSC family protein n=1 Tax=Micropruina sp. TaxID=2737536 RepID=UPI0039E42A65